jgi:signal peptidase I
MIKNQLVINGKNINYEKSTENNDQLEHLFNITHSIRVSSAIDHAFANFPTVTVPVDQYLVLGDNRDNSADSRVIGFVPRNEFVGRSSSVIMSFDYDNFYIPRAERFFKSL